MIHSFLLIGQSNMAGRGFLHEAKDVDTTHIKILRNGRWQRMFRPVNNDRHFSGVCLGESFAERYAKEFETDVGLICCADGGTSLEQWKKGSILFDNAVYQAKLAQRTSVISGILWHQGEADCAPELCATYKVRFEKFANDLREALNLYDVPLLIGGLGEFLKDCELDELLVNYDKLNDEFKKIAAENDYMGYVSAEGLGANPDNLHFNAESLYEFGIRYYEEFLKFKPVSSGYQDKAVENDSERTFMENL